MAGHLNFSDDIGVRLREQPRIATTRMRKAFRYPAEDSDDDVPADGIDEEEQEAMISKLSARDATSTKVYQAVFLVVPLMTIVVYTPSLVAPATATAFFRSVVAITSLLATAYILYGLPIEGWRNPAVEGSQPRGIPSMTGPIDRYIGYLNGGLSAVLALGAYSAWQKGNEDAAWLGITPGIVFLLIIFIRTQLKPVDFSELHALKYRYKGA